MKRAVGLLLAFLCLAAGLSGCGNIRKQEGYISLSAYGEDGNAVVYLYFISGTRTRTFGLICTEDTELYRWNEDLKQVPGDWELLAPETFDIYNISIKVEYKNEKVEKPEGVDFGDGLEWHYATKVTVLFGNYSGLL